MNMENCFAYGTLMCEDIMAEVSGCRLPFVSGILRGYSRRRVKGELYPAIVPDENSAVQGVVYQNLPDTAWARLDRFEGEMYMRMAVKVELDDKAHLLAETYVIHPEFMDLLELSDWNYSEFLRTGKDGFQKGYRGYQKL